VIDLPDTPVGGAASAFVEVLRGAPFEALAARLTPQMARIATPEAVASIAAELGDVAVTRIGHQTPHHLVARLSGDGDTVLRLAVEAEAPHRITGIVLDGGTGEPWEPIDDPTPLGRVRDELELAALAGAVVARGRTWTSAVGGVDEHSRFSIGSITKTMTAALVRQLIDDGLVARGDALDALLPDVRVPDGVTIDLVLDHRSGVVSDAPLEGAPDVAGLFDRHPLRLAFEPGSQRAYSNAGYALLGHLVEHVLGVPYATALATHVFAPAGMTESGTDASDVLPGYLSLAGTLRPVQWLDVALPGAGAVISTAADMARYVEAVLDGGLPRAGWREDGGVAWHNGGWDGFSAMAWLHLDHRRASVLLTNTGGVTGTGLLEPYAARMIDEVCGVD
jgi:CubicO group peptidase (beta-lactamase class C family)